MQHSKIIVLAEGNELQIDKQKPADAFLEVFLLSKLVFYLLGECNEEEKQKLLLAEVHFAKTRLGFTFCNNAGDDAPDDLVATGILNWAEREVKPELSASTFHRLQRVVAEMKKNLHDAGKLDPHVTADGNGMRPHRFHQALESRKQPQETTATTEPIPLDVASSLPEIQASDIVGLFGSTAAAGRITRTSSKRQRVDYHVEYQEAFPAPGPSTGKRTLGELKQELDERHPQSNKKRKIRKHDVVSGKGERSKQQNQHYLEMIRNHAPSFRGMNTGNPDVDVEEKRKMACYIALKIVDHEGRFVDKDGTTMSAKAAIKRVMTSLKDWKPPRKSRAQPSTSTTRIVSKEPQDATNGMDIEPLPSQYHSTISDQSIDDEIVGLFDNDPSDSTWLGSVGV